MQVDKGTMFEEFLSAWLWWKKEDDPKIIGRIVRVVKRV